MSSPPETRSSRQDMHEKRQYRCKTYTGIAIPSHLFASEVSSTPQVPRETSLFPPSPSINGNLSLSAFCLSFSSPFFRFPLLAGIDCVGLSPPNVSLGGHSNPFSRLSLDYLVLQQHPQATDCYRQPACIREPRIAAVTAKVPEAGLCARGGVACSRQA